MFRFAYIEFADLETTTKNYKEMQNKKIREKEIIVDYVDERSSYTKKELKKEQTPKEKDLKRLHIGGFDKTANEKDLKKLFNGCSDFALPISKKDGKLNMGSVRLILICLYLAYFYCFFFYFPQDLLSLHLHLKKTPKKP